MSAGLMGLARKRIVTRLLWGGGREWVWSFRTEAGSP